MQGTAGHPNNLSLLVLDELGQTVHGQADQLNVSMSLFPPPVNSSSTYIRSVENSEEGGVIVVWNGTAATPADNSVAYQLNVTLKSSGQVCYSQWQGFFKD